MKFSAKLDYAMVALIDLAMSTGEGPIQVKHIAARQGLSGRFLEQVMTHLKKAGLIESHRGAQGGYRLARGPAEIRLGDVLIAVEGPPALMTCLSDETFCISHEGIVVGDCVVREVWDEVKRSILSTLNAITLKEMCERKQRKEAHRQLITPGVLN